MSDQVPKVEPLSDDLLEAASGGQMETNSTEVVYASTFIPFDSSF